MKRPRLQLHLATCLLLMLTASGFLYLNVRDKAFPGFPYKVIREYPQVLISVNFTAISYSDSDRSPVNPFASPPIPPPLFDTSIQLIPLLENIAIALATLALVAFTSEFFLRRSKPRIEPVVIAEL